MFKVFYVTLFYKKKIEKNPKVLTGDKICYQRSPPNAEVEVKFFSLHQTFTKNKYKILIHTSFQDYYILHSTQYLKYARIEMNIVEVSIWKKCNFYIF